ncbi:hypothetical protein ABB37_03211 [Leptomonas pyrrhocoris]|uniref:ENTH domain-containing protein n=1 Tax=Leptomonas pyrrhocoris TaxID=157538 RepID=A0A0N0VG14_LEPPY|nr:hypothetical protein ABB37_03211 [Leptomonas pyrrhocoris]KPA82044.1 hypothetical protein ABB37_03211 [Leptomonas pyrrhocoris]|eukprot:XP_015660483.1 hypothetical protein ABB37_03211 [Leptomonas pyrrhocoris]
MNKSDFKKAVADSEAPTPGYLYRDMASWTYLDYATQLQLIKALFDKLQNKNSAFVLYKALHLIKVLCETGQEGFQKELQLSKYANVVKDFTTYRGPLDVKYADSWNEKVRCEAQAALEAIFQTRTAASMGPTTLSGGANGDWSGAGNSAVEQKAVKGTWGSGSGTEPVLPSFSTSSPCGGNSFLRDPPPQVGGPSSSFDAPSSHIGEMPSENRWAAHRREVAALGSSRAASTADKPSKTLLQQLASTAKSGMSLITQFEILKGKQERLYGDQFGQAARATTRQEGVAGHLGGGRGVDEVGSYQPVGVSVPMRMGEAVEHLSTRPPSMTPVLDDQRASSASSSPPRSHPQTRGGSAVSLPSGPSSPAPQSNASHDAAEELIHSFACLKQVPSRVDLSRLLRVMGESADAREQADASLGAYGVQLASALGVHLVKEKPWQERRNALASLEAVLRGSSAAIHDGVADFYARQPHLVQANCSVVQASLKEKAGRVAQLLNIPAVPISAAPTAPSIKDRGIVPNAAPTEASAPQRSHFEDLLGGSTPPAAAPSSSSSSPNPSAASSLPQTALRSAGGHDSTFEGMTIRPGGSSSLRRGDPPGDALDPPSDTNRISFGGDDTGRPQRRTNRVATVAAEMPVAGSGERRTGESAVNGGGGAGSIQVLRHCGGNSSGNMATATAAGTTAAQQRTQQQHVNVNKTDCDLDNLLGLSPPATAAPPTSSANATSTTLDDLFGGQPTTISPASLSSANKSSKAGTDDLFVDSISPSFAPPSLSNVPSPHIASAAQLARIQGLMEYLETRYDPAAMTELERLILQRQQALQQMTTHQGSAEEVMGPGPRAAQPHRQFQLGGPRSGPMSERQQANSQFADVQAEMKRKLDL